MNSKYDSIDKLRQALIVSAQASEGEPLNSPQHLAALALSGLNGGARGLRLEGGENISFIRKLTGFPIIGLIKSEEVPDDKRLSSVYITPAFKDAALCAASGADIIAIDATQRPRPDGLSLKGLIDRIHIELNKPVWADVSTIAEGKAASEAGADVISTTLYGYTQETKQSADAPPDFELLAGLCKSLKQPVVLEGRVWHPEELRRAFEIGAYAVVVGSAITRPQLITKRFMRAIPVRA